jgi:hypothetical protein
MPAILIVVLSTVFLAGCSYPPLPVVDMQGVDPVKYNRDAAECAEHAETAFEFGNAATNCMRKKGYKILYGY